MFGNQHHGDSHHDFIGNRVEEGAKTGALIPATSEETIKPVYMGGLQGLQQASVEEIAKVPGISHALAEKIFYSLKH